MNLLIIRQLAKEKNITLKELAEKSGISEQGMQKILREENTKISTLYSIANVLEVPITKFFEDIVESRSVYKKDPHPMAQKCQGCVRRDEDIAFLRGQLDEKSDYIRMLKEQLHEYQEELRNCLKQK